jgi:hypothetical protein
MQRRQLLLTIEAVVSSARSTQKAPPGRGFLVHRVAGELCGSLGSVKPVALSRNGVWACRQRHLEGQALTIAVDDDRDTVSCVLARHKVDGVLLRGDRRSVDAGDDATSLLGRRPC